MLTNFGPKRLTPKLDIVEQSENLLHRLTDSNVSRERSRRPMFVVDVGKMKNAYRWSEGAAGVQAAHNHITTRPQSIHNN